MQKLGIFKNHRIYLKNLMQHITIIYFKPDSWHIHSAGLLRMYCGPSTQYINKSRFPALDTVQLGRETYNSTTE